LRGEQPWWELRRAHLEREDGDAGPVLGMQSRVPRTRQGERRLAHRRPCRDDDQVRSLKAARVLVEPREAARDPGDAALAAVDRLELLERRLDDVGDGRRRTAKLRIRYTEDLRLGLVEQLECVRRRVVG